MPVLLPSDLPAAQQLRRDGMLLSSLMRARPPLRVGMVNLMPCREDAELQFARQLGLCSQPVELLLTLPPGHVPRNTARDHVQRFYVDFRQLAEQPLHGLIVTGAPVEHLPFEEVRYWRALTAIMDWARARAVPSLFVCWAAQAALYHRHGVCKHALPRKLSGVYRQQLSAAGRVRLPYMGRTFPAPVSRQSEVRAGDLPAGRGLLVAAASTESGLCLVEDVPARASYMFNHLEYAATTLAEEYARDRRAGRAAALPHNYFPHDVLSVAPENTWADAARQFFGGWLRGIDACRRGAARRELQPARAA
jgi:homoserine O-succinyltransferase